jgi:hypothetical protein
VLCKMGGVGDASGAGTARAVLKEVRESTTFLISTGSLPFLQRIRSGLHKSTTPLRVRFGRGTAIFDEPDTVADDAFAQSRASCSSRNNGTGRRGAGCLARGPAVDWGTRTASSGSAGLGKLFIEQMFEDLRAQRHLPAFLTAWKVVHALRSFQNDTRNEQEKLQADFGSSKGLGFPIPSFTYCSAWPTSIAGGKARAADAGSEDCGRSATA